MKRIAGFSLLEVLVSLVILGIIGGALAQTMGMSVRALKQSTTFAERDEAVIVRARLRQWIEAMKPPSSLTGVSQNIIADGTGLSFVTTTTPPLGMGAAELRIEVRQDDRNTLVVIHGLSPQADIVWSDTRVLSENTPLHLRYFDVAEEEWLDTWEDTSRAPSLVSISDETRGDESWPPFIVETLLK